MSNDPVQTNTQQLIGEITRDCVTSIVERVNETKGNRSEKATLMTSAVTSIVVSIIVTASHHYNDEAEATNEMFAFIVRGAAEALATFQGPIGSAIGPLGRTTQ